MSLGRVGDGVPPPRAGRARVGDRTVRNLPYGRGRHQEIDVGADATALAGPGEPPLGALMPFVAQNPLGPFIPGDQYQIRSEDEGECGTASLHQHLADLAGASGVALASYVQPKTQDSLFAAAPPSVPVADPSSTTFTTSVTVTLSAESGAKIHYTTDGSTPTTTSAMYSGPLTFTSTTTLKAIATKGSQASEIGTFTYTQGTPPESSPRRPATARSSSAASRSRCTTTAGSTIYYTPDGTIRRPPRRSSLGDQPHRQHADPRDGVDGRHEQRGVDLQLHAAGRYRAAGRDSAVRDGVRRRTLNIA